VDPLSALRHPYGDVVGADQPRGHTVGYHEPISGYCTLGIWRQWAYRGGQLWSYAKFVVYASAEVSLAIYVSYEKRESFQLIKYF
jgi:hypothetical protein